MYGDDLVCCLHAVRLLFFLYDRWIGIVQFQLKTKKLVHFAFPCALKLSIYKSFWSFISMLHIPNRLLMNFYFIILNHFIKDV